MSQIVIEEMLLYEYKEYTESNTLTRYERKKLFEWVFSGHSVYEAVMPKYAPGPPYPPMDFIEAYRFDRMLAKEMKGMRPKEKIKFLKEYFGYDDEESTGLSEDLDLEWIE